MTSTEVSLDAPVERQDRGASTFGERVAGNGQVEIEEMTDSPAPARVHRPPLPASPHPPRAQDPLPLLRPRGRLRGAHPREDRRAARRHPRAHPADPRARVREAARQPGREGAAGVLGSGVGGGRKAERRNGGTAEGRTGRKAMITASGASCNQRGAASRVILRSASAPSRPSARPSVPPRPPSAASARSA